MTGPGVVCPAFGDLARSREGTVFSVSVPTAYFDAATAAPLHPVARQALLAALDDGWADPGKLYTQARRARQLLDAAREATAQTLGVRADELSFTPSGTT